MSQDRLPSPTELAESFVTTSCVVWFQEDIYCFSHKTGKYEKKKRGWLDHHVSIFLIGCLGSHLVDASLVSNVSKVIKNLTYVDSNLQPPFWLTTQKPADVFVTSNGIIAIDGVASGTPPVLLPHTSDLFAVCSVPYRYDPNAACPKWLEFLRWMVGRNEGEVALLQQFCAWVLIACRLKLEKFLWLCGPGGNGKSTFLQLVRWVLGEDSTSAVGMDAFQGASTFRLSPTLHKLANICFDAVVRRNSDVAGLNAFVSNDPFTINRKYRDQVTVEPTTVCFFASNPTPSLDDPSDAFWRRLLLIRCEQRLAQDQIDPTLIPKLKEEAAGILNWVLAAVPTVLERRRFDIPESVILNVESLKADVNSARQFINEKLEASDNVEDTVFRDQLMSSYGVWCKLNLAKEESFDLVKQEIRRAFNVELKRPRRGAYSAHEKGHGRVYGWKEIRWKEGEQPLAPVRDRVVENLQDKLDEREAEIRKLKEKLSQHQPIKNAPAARHMAVQGGPDNSSNSSGSPSPDQSNEITSEDLSDLFIQLGDNGPDEVTGESKEACSDYSNVPHQG